MAEGQAQAQGPLPLDPAVQAFNNLRIVKCLAGINGAENLDNSCQV